MSDDISGNRANVADGGCLWTHTVIVGWYWKNDVQHMLLDPNRALDPFARKSLRSKISCGEVAQVKVSFESIDKIFDRTDSEFKRLFPSDPVSPELGTSEAEIWTNRRRLTDFFVSHKTHPVPGVVQNFRPMSDRMDLKGGEERRYGGKERGPPIKAPRAEEAASNNGWTAAASTR
ncbi:hypothetical protein BC829DRAFT_441592 [Chytridium lagenaria]|nr:hypothetical protein BC829DRAFT_441592 [Chytridium lagenaria]